MSTEPVSFRHQATSEAAHWFVVMQRGDASEADRERFALWLAESARHVREYLAVTEAWRLSSEVTQQDFSTEELIRCGRADLEGSAVIAFRETPATGVKTPPRTRRRVWVAAAALGAVAVLASLWWSSRVEVIEYRTWAGDRLTASLADGSTVQLNMRTHVRVHLTPGFRDIELLDGEALFQVAKDLRRPFRVFSGRNEIRAVGTAFNVNRKLDVTTVTVLEGRVEVAPLGAGKPLSVERAGKNNPASPTPAIVSLVPRQQASLTHDGRLVKAQDVDVMQVTKWTQPLLRFSDEPLSAVVAKFNQYSNIHMILQDPQLGATRVSGVFSSGDVSSFIEYLQRAEHVVVVEKDADTRLVYRRAPAVVGR